MLDRFDGLRQGRDVGIEPLVGLDVDVGTSVDGLLNECLGRKQVGVGLRRLPEEQGRELRLAAKTSRPIPVIFPDR